MNEKTPMELIAYLVMGILTGACIWAYFITYALTLEETWLCIVIVLGGYGLFIVTVVAIPIILMYIQSFMSGTLRWFLEH